MRSISFAAIAAAALALPASAQAADILDFEGLANNAQVGGFYAGYSFSSKALALIDSDAGGTGVFANEPSPDTIMWVYSGTGGPSTSAWVNVAAGFDTGISFFYQAGLEPAYVNVYDGFGASGNLLGSVALPPQRTGNDCTGDPTGPLCNWTAAGVGFAGIAKSVEFEGPSGYFAFDDLAFGVAPPSGAVPEPATWALMLLGFGAIGGAMRRQRTRVAYA